MSYNWEDLETGALIPGITTEYVQKEEPILDAGFDLAYWLTVAQAAGPLAEKYGPQIAHTIQQWWGGSVEQVHLGTVHVRRNEQFLVDMRNADDECSLVMPGFAATIQLGHPPLQRIWTFDLPGQSAFVIKSTNWNGPWSCNVSFFRQNPSGGFDFNRPFLFTRTNGNDNLWVNRVRLYLGTIQVE